MDALYDSRPWLKHYPDSVPADLPIAPDTILDDFNASTDRRPDAPAVYYFDHILSYGQIDRFSDQLAAALLALDLQKGDRLILDLQNVPQFLIATYAAWKIGVIVVPVNPMYKERELLYFCQDSGARVMIVHDTIAAKLDLSFLKETAVKHVIATSALDFLPHGAPRPELLKDVEKVSVSGTVDLLELMQSHPNPTLPEPELVPDDIAFLTYT